MNGEEYRLFVISEDALLDALRRASEGEHPDFIITGLVLNAKIHERYRGDDDGDLG